MVSSEEYAGRGCRKALTHVSQAGWESRNVDVEFLGRRGDERENEDRFRIRML